MCETMLAILVIKTVILALGSGIAFIAYKAHRRTETPSLRVLAVGFGIIVTQTMKSPINTRVSNL